MLRATVDPDWKAGRAVPNTSEGIDALGELWSFYREAVAKMRDPAAVPFCWQKEWEPRNLPTWDAPRSCP